MNQTNVRFETGVEYMHMLTDYVTSFFKTSWVHSTGQIRWFLLSQHLFRNLNKKLITVNNISSQIRICRLQTTKSEAI